MDLATLFADYYIQYRGQAVVPAVTNPEYAIFISYAREAIARWASYDNTYWKTLFMTLQNASDGDKVIRANKTQYTCPSNMKEVGGYLKITNPTTGTTVLRYPILEPQDVQFKTDNSFYCYVTGDPQNGFIMNLNPNPQTNIVGFNMDYVYYALPTLWDSTSQPSATTEMTEPMFIVHRALASRYRSTRNPYYNTAKSDGEDVLKIMQMNNNSGNWSDPFSIPDHSGTNWGQERGY